MVRIRLLIACIVLGGIGYWASTSLGGDSSGAADPIVLTIAESWKHTLLLAVLAAVALLVLAVTCLVRFLRQLTARTQRSEARTRMMLDHGPDGIFVIDDDGVVELCNRAAQRIFGSTTDEILGGHYSQWFEPLAPGGNAGFSELASRRTIAQTTAQHADGTRLSLELTASQVCTPAGPLWIVAFREIGQRLVVEQQSRRDLAALRDQIGQLEEKVIELGQINLELEEFAWMASHDLQEPLRGITSQCQILLDDFAPQFDAEGARRLEMLVQLCGRLSQLVDDLLTHASLSHAEASQESTDLNEVVGNVLETLGPRYSERRAAVQVVDRLPVVAGDATMIGTVFRNLIANALKFNDSREPRVEIGCRGVDGLTLYVRDNGIGIAPRHHEEVFAMFRRLHNRQKYEGSGAGLTFVRKIVETQGGRVWLDSTPGEGSTFYFTLPAAKTTRHRLDGATTFRAPAVACQEESAPQVNV